MKRFPSPSILPVLVAGALMACGPSRPGPSGDSLPAATVDPSSLVPTAISDSAQVVEIDRMRRETDSLAALPGARMTQLALWVDSSFHRVAGDDWPEGAEALYAVYQDPTGAVRMALESPASPSGDLALVVTHWFDADGLTRLIEVSYGRVTLCLDQEEESVSGAEVTTIYRATDGRELQRKVRRAGGKDGTTDLSALTSCSTVSVDDYTTHANWKAMEQATGLARAGLTTGGTN
jgi:hypothetical protein